MSKRCQSGGRDTFGISKHLKILQRSRAIENRPLGSSIPKSREHPIVHTHSPFLSHVLLASAKPLIKPVGKTSRAGNPHKSPLSVTRSIIGAGDCVRVLLERQRKGTFFRGTLFRSRRAGGVQGIRQEFKANSALLSRLCDPPAFRLPLSKGVERRCGAVRGRKRTKTEQEAARGGGLSRVYSRQAC